MHDNNLSPSGGARSNLVKKMFYGKNSSDQVPQPHLEDDEAKPFGQNNNNMVMNSQMEALLAKK